MDKLWVYKLMIYLFLELASPIKSTPTIQDRDCLDIWNYEKIYESGIYEIDVDGNGHLPPVYVECHMGSGADPNEVLTVVHHDAEDTSDVRSYEAPGSYSLNVTYINFTEEHLTSLIDLSFSCQQYIKWACKGSMFGLWYPREVNNWWAGRNWKKQYYWGGAETDSRTCGCHPYCTRSKRNSTCNCDVNDKRAWLEDDGLLLDKNRLPVLQLRFGDTGEFNEAGQHTLGPLICRTQSHKEIIVDEFKAPCNFTTPGYPKKYPAAFCRYTWSIRIAKGDTMELVFPDYDVVHFGSYNAVRGCDSVVTVLAQDNNPNELVTIKRQKSPPYYASEGFQTIVNVTLITCNQDERVPLGKGFKAAMRRTECPGCKAGLGLNGKTTYCELECGIIASREYPFPHHYYLSLEEAREYNHTWILKVSQKHVVELEFRDFDIPQAPGSRNCTPAGGIIWIYSGEEAKRQNLIGLYCNLNKQAFIYSTSNAMTLVFATRLRKVGNGRGFHAIYRKVAQPTHKKFDFSSLPNIAEGKPTRQSSTRDLRYAYFGVDGKINKGAATQTCAATELENDPWWQVNLQKRYLVYGFELYSAKAESQIKDHKLTWPDGTYGLPMPVSGCPTSKGFSWETGYRFQDLEFDIVQDDKVDHWSHGMLLKGGWQKMTIGGEKRSGIEQHFCIKTQSTTSEDAPREWPPGEYCIFMYGDDCPPSFKSGYITWNDTCNFESDSYVEGFYPRGYYTNQTTTIYFCCRNDSKAEEMIKLPKYAPFYLLKFGKTCQKVEGMSEREQYFHFIEDEPPLMPTNREYIINGIPKYKEPHPNIDKEKYDKGIALYYCYYDIFRSLRGFRVTVDETGLVDTYIQYYDDLSYGIRHSEEGKFLHSYICSIYPVTEPEFHVLKVNCTQPIHGQYVTLQIYNRFDSLQFCEMKIFGTESCGQPLGMASEEIFDSQINASSCHVCEKYHHTNGRLNADNGWCAAFNDTSNKFTVDLQNTTKVTGVILQDLNGVLKKTQVTKFYLSFSNDSQHWTWEEEPVGHQKIYNCEQCKSEFSDSSRLNVAGMRYNLLKGIPTRFIQIQILKFSHQPCMRMEIMGCREKIPCKHTISEPTGVVSSPNHPRYYGQDKSCSWIIKPVPGKHIELNFIIYELAEQDDVLNSGTCRDQLTVYSGIENRTAVRSPDGKRFPKRIISNGTMEINLESCFKYSRSRYRGFYAHYKSVDCPGCGVGDFPCSKVHECESECGEIVSIGHPLNYQNNHRCGWLIRAKPLHFINVTFQDFDIVGGENCKYDYLVIYDGGTNDKSNLIGRFCNAKKPNVEIVSSWNSLLIEFSSDAENTGRGFALKYSSNSFKMSVDTDHIDNCHGCGVGDFPCSKLHECESECGEIVSIGHPLNYQNNQRCGWLIRAKPLHFINVTFQDFDIVGGENCQYDYLVIYDGETNDESNLIGRFCNAKKPNVEIVASWHSVLIEFSSDAENSGRGFALKYFSTNFEMASDPEDTDNTAECPIAWKYYNGKCYNAYEEKDAIQWHEAEARCRNESDNAGHLLSILDEKENDIVHFFLTNFWDAKHKSLYIGLNDENIEASYRWTDGNPLIYTDCPHPGYNLEIESWMEANYNLCNAAIVKISCHCTARVKTLRAKADRLWRTQPDGGAFEDCTMLRVDSGHSTAHWHDIPCSLGKLSFHNKNDIKWGESSTTKPIEENEALSLINSYICKMDSYKQNAKMQLEVRPENKSSYITETSVTFKKYFQCINGEIISSLFVCNYEKDCRDSSDEENCFFEECPPSNFQCNNKKCVSLAVYCDYKDDCGDFSDESTCNYRKCQDDEFECDSGQCIPLEQKCDLLPNCFDKSDEKMHLCKGNCNPNNTFQCYDGTCIPIDTLCDGYRDCPGKYQEDEQNGCTKNEDRKGQHERKNLCSQRDRKTCLDLYILDNIHTSGYYTIDSDGSDGPILPFTVYCEMSSNPDEVTTIIHHDSEMSIYVRSNRDGPGSYSRKLVYSVGMDKIKALTNASAKCSQEISWKCYGTGFHFYAEKPWSWWVSWVGEPQYMWGDAIENNTCGCNITACKNPKRPCNCDSVKKFEGSEDKGTLTNKNTLPVSEVIFGNTYKAGQYGYHQIGPLKCSGNAVEDTESCTNTTEFMQCQNGHFVNSSLQCLYEFDKYGYPVGCRDMTHLRNCENFECPEDYVKCPDKYCIPTKYVCDGKWDCIGGGDEKHCENYTCPGHYKCYNSSSCLPLYKRCNKERDCPEGDDELLCDFVCPVNCTCIGLFISCVNQNSSRLPPNFPQEVRKLDFSHNLLDLQNADFSNFLNLGELLLKHNFLKILPPNKFLHLQNLYKLDLSNNRLSFISSFAFKGLKNVRLLYLENNPSISEIESEAFNGLTNLTTLNLTGISAKVIRKNTFTGMSNLKTLNLQNNKIEKVENNAFFGLNSLAVLDITGNDILYFTSDIFSGLKSLEYLYSDTYTFCCMASSQMPLVHCFPLPDEISSCKDLMSNAVQRSFLWVLGIVGLVCNLFVIIWRLKIKDSNMISSTLILSLGFADFLMGIYLLIIASVDVYYRDIYIENSDRWKRSVLCKICGFLSTVSTEVSVLTLTFITMDRFICLCFPLSQKRFSLQFTYKLITSSWIIAAVMAVIPLVIEPYFQGRFYARSGVCLALHITNQRPAGWEYSVAIFFCMNVLAFIFIVSAYVYMYYTIRKSYKNMNRLMTRNSRENKIGRQMALIALTNSMCWFPIIVMGLLAMCGINIAGEAYSWTAIFVLPLNSATNPLIYTISSLHFHTRLLSRFGLGNKDLKDTSNLSNSRPSTEKNKRMALHDQLNSRSFKPPHGYVTLLHYLRTVPGLRPRHLLKIATAICKTLAELHAGSYALGGIDVNAVFVSQNSEENDEIHVYVPDFNAYKITSSPISGVPDDTAEDMEEFGFLLKKMLRVYHVVSRSNDPMQGTAC